MVLFDVRVTDVSRTSYAGWRLMDWRTTDFGLALNDSWVGLKRIFQLMELMNA